MKIFRYLLLSCFFLCLTVCVFPQNPDGTEHIEIDYAFKLYGQTRRYKMDIVKNEEGAVRFDWTIFSYQKWLKGTYFISPKGLCCGSKLNFLQPVDKMQAHLADDETFGLVSVEALKSIKESQNFVYNNTTYRLFEKQKMSVGSETLDVYYVVADIDNTEMWIWDNENLPLIIRIEKNPLEINFEIEKFERK